MPVSGSQWWTQQRIEGVARTSGFSRRSGSPQSHPWRCARGWSSQPRCRPKAYAPPTTDLRHALNSCPLYIWLLSLVQFGASRDDSNCCRLQMPICIRTCPPLLVQKKEGSGTGARHTVAGVDPEGQQQKDRGTCADRAGAVSRHELACLSYIHFTPSFESYQPNQMSFDMAMER